MRPLIFVVLACVTFTWGAPAEAAGCSGSTDGLTFTLGCQSSHGSGAGHAADGVTHSVDAPVVPDAGAGTGVCGAVATVDPTACQPTPVGPQVTPGVVAQAFQQVAVPKLASVTQPAGRTLVNFATIFYVQAAPFDATVTLLGQQVVLHVRPVRYAWDHGDGTTAVTVVPGLPYPRQQVVYRYQHANIVYAHRVAVTWAATFQVAGGPAAEVPGTVTTTGPATPIRVVEATPVLTGNR